jgi:hypothetical protein
MTTASTTAILSVPASKSDATVSVTVPSNKTGIGVVYWLSEAGSYWASYSNTSTGLGASNCNNGNCSGSENYQATRNCGCTSNYGTCAYVTGTCALSYTDVYGTCNYSYATCSQTYGTCSLSQTFGTCSSTYSYGTCSYTAGSTTYSYFTVNKFSDDCSFYANTTQICAGFCNGSGGCTAGSNRGCCRTTTVTSGTWNLSGCSYSGQQVITGSSWNYGGCSYAGQQVVTGSSWNYSGCSSNGQQVATGWNYSGCSSNGQQIIIGWNYGGCSSVGQQVYLGQSSSWNYGGCSSVGQTVNIGWNYSGCSSVGQQVVVSQSSNCNNGSCSGTEQYTTSRSCSCPTITTKTIKTIKSVNGTISNVGSFEVSSTPTTISAVTSGTGVIVSAAGSSGSYTNNDGTTYKSFGIMKNDGGTEQGSSASSFSVIVS